MFWDAAEDYDGAAERGLFWQVAGVEGEADGDAVTIGLRRDDCSMVRVREEKKLGFWLCEGDRVMRCHSMIGYFSEWRIEDVACFNC